jgi:REP-associated tyrosine transposase
MAPYHRLDSPRGVNIAGVPTRLVRYQQTRDLHFITFTCYHRRPHLADASARDLFEQMLEQTRRLYQFYVSGYVVMPEHVHLVVSEPERRLLSVAMQVLKQAVARRQRVATPPFWQARYYDRNIWSAEELSEKLRYIHENPLRRGLVANAEDWPWSSFRHYATGEERVVEVESQWTARKRERSGKTLKLGWQSLMPHPSKTS